MPLTPVDPADGLVRRTRAGLLAIAVLALLLLALAWVMVDVRIQAGRARATADELTKNDNLALAHRERSQRALDVYDQALRFVRQDYLRHGVPAEFKSRLAEVGLDLRFVPTLSIIDTEGHMLATTTETRAGTFTDRDYFRFHAADPSDQLRVGAPIQGRLSGRWGIPLTLRITRADGRFGGVVFLLLDLDYFAALYRETDAPRNGAMALIGLDGITRVRRNGNTISFGDDIRASQLFKELTKARAGHYTAAAAVDGVQRLVSYSQLEGYPLVVIVAASMADLLAQGHGREQAIRTAAALSALLLLLLAGGGALWLVRSARSRQALAGSEQRFRRLFETSPDAVLRCTPQGQVLAANPAACRLFGIAAAAWPARTLDALADPADARWPALRDRPSQDAPVQGAVRLLGATGQPFEAEWSAVTYREAAAQPVLSVVVRDISDRRRLEDALRASSEELADLYEHAPCAYYSLDGQGQILRLNATMLAWLGLPREAVVGRPITAFYGEEGRAQFAEHFPRFVAEGQVAGLEFDLTSADGATRRVSLSATAEKDAQGRYLFSRSVMFDITELHRTRAALQAVNGEQQAMLDNDLVGMMKLHGCEVVWANRGMQRFFGHAAADLVGHTTRRLFPDEASFLAASEWVESTSGTRAEVQQSMQMQRADGSFAWIDARGVLLSRHSGESLWLLVDATEARQAEALRLKAGALEAENRQLLEAGRLKSRFMANMSHELRTPLNAVIGFAALLRHAPFAQDAEKYQGFVRQIGASGRLLLQLINDVLDLAKAEADKLTLQPQAVDLPTLVREAVEMQRAAAESRHIALGVEVDPALGPALLDPLRFRQCLTNYLTNAIKFTPDFGQVQVLALAEAPDRVRVEVADSGIGIAAADLPRLFTEFEQISSGAARRYGGTGLGLALTRRIVQAMGGQVGVSSTPDAGSRFHFTLPLQPVPPPPPPDQRPA